MSYKRWDKVYTFKQLAILLQSMQEYQISKYNQFTTAAEGASARFHTLTDQLRLSETDLTYVSELMRSVVQYTMTWPMFDKYKRSRIAKDC